MGGDSNTSPTRGRNSNPNPNPTLTLTLIKKHILLYRTSHGMAFCTGCGQEMMAGMNFCGNCGAPSPAPFPAGATPTPVTEGALLSLPCCIYKGGLCWLASAVMHLQGWPLLACLCCAASTRAASAGLPLLLWPEGTSYRVVLC